MPISTPMSRLLLLYCLICLLGLWQQAQAQEFGLPNVIERKGDAFVREKIRDGREAATEAYKDKKKELLQEGKQNIRDAKRDFPSQAKEALKNNYRYNTYLDELIQDPEARAEIQNRQNKGRYIDLFGQWWTLPSQAQLDLLDSLRRLRMQQAQLDSSEFYFTKYVKGTQQPVIIFGWHAAWHGGVYGAYDYQRLTAVSYYSYDVDPVTGLPQNPEDLVGFNAFAAKVKKEERSPLLSVAIRGAENQERFFRWDNQPARRRLIDSVISMLDSSKADGIELHFMDLAPPQKEEFQKFVIQFSASLRAIVRDSANPGDRYRFLLSVPAYDPFDVYNLTNLRDHFDYVVVLGFDFQNTPEALILGDFKKTPVAPLNYSLGDPNYDLRNCVDRYLNSLGRFQSYRMILALPYFGTQWQQQGARAELLDRLPYSQIRFQFPADTILGSRIRIDSARTTMIWEYTDTMGMSQGRQPIDLFIFYDDVWTLRKKYQFINDTRLGGVGLWFLADGLGFSELNTLLDEEFKEFRPPNNDALAKLNAGTNWARKYAPVALTILLYWGIFMALGFCLDMLKEPTRQALFMRPRFRFFYLTFFTILILVIGNNLGLFEGPALTLAIGVTIGTAIAWLALKFLRSQQAASP